MIGKCGKCAYMMHQGSMNVCALHRQEVSPTEDYCSKIKYDLTVCEFCGGAIVIDPVLEFDETGLPHFLCFNCATAYNCKTCKNAAVCSFETDKTVFEPKYLNNNFTQKNPERVKKTCTNCPCYKNEQCCKENNYCGEWRIRYANRV